MYVASPQIKCFNPPFYMSSLSVHTAQFHWLVTTQVLKLNATSTEMMTKKRKAELLSNEAESVWIYRLVRNGIINFYDNQRMFHFSKQKNVKISMVSASFLSCSVRCTLINAALGVQNYGQFSQFFDRLSTNQILSWIISWKTNS